MGTAWTILDAFLADHNSIEIFGRVTRAYSAKGKQKLLDQLRNNNAEGIVFKRLDAPYQPGRPASGGSQFKYKFYSTATFVVEAVNNNKRSVQLCLLDNHGVSVKAGNVTIPANQDIPLKGDLVEVRYLYAYKESGAVFQPVYLGKRNDVELSDCTVGQLKYKPDTL